MRCSKCNQDNSIEAIFHNKRGMKFQFCEDCISKIDFSNIDTYKWFFEILNIPYIPEKMNNIINFYSRYRLLKNDKSNVLRSYWAKMVVDPCSCQRYTIDGKPICRNCQQNEGQECYKNKDNISFYFCKECIEKVSLSDTDSYIWFFYILDLPYLQDEWNSTIDYCEKSYPEKMPTIVFRKYLGKVRLAPYKSLKFNNSDFTIEGEK